LLAAFCFNRGRLRGRNIYFLKDSKHSPLN